MSGKLNHDEDKPYLIKIGMAFEEYMSNLTDDEHRDLVQLDPREPFAGSLPESVYSTECYACQEPLYLDSKGITHEISISGRLIKHTCPAND